MILLIFSQTSIQQIKKRKDQKISANELKDQDQ